MIVRTYPRWTMVASIRFGMVELAGFYNGVMEAYYLPYRPKTTKGFNEILSSREGVAARIELLKRLALKEQKVRRLQK